MFDDEPPAPGNGDGAAETGSPPGQVTKLDGPHAAAERDAIAAPVATAASAAATPEAAVLPIAAAARPGRGPAVLSGAALELERAGNGR